MNEFIHVTHTSIMTSNIPPLQKLLCIPLSARLPTGRIILIQQKILFSPAQKKIKESQLLKSSKFNISSCTKAYYIQLL